ncbi:hypothetical protein F4859DRAFT_123798 [Xylaria cf. heliscus]|nr:hypothetical protein F4859DRAFT_123798 [Xylaria cf. heliscus]
MGCLSAQSNPPIAYTYTRLLVMLLLLLYRRPPLNLEPTIGAVCSSSASFESCRAPIFLFSCVNCSCSCSGPQPAIFSIFRIALSSLLPLSSLGLLGQLAHFYIYA